MLSPSWKPLPVLITTPLALLGNAAPLVWLVVARAAGLGALAMVYAVADRLAGRLAGVVAATTLALSAGWLRAMEHGYSEPLLVLLLIPAIYRHLDGHRLQALALGTLVGLGRPEIWPLLLFYAVVLWRGLPGRRLAIAGLVSAVPVLWFGGDLLGSGDAFHGREVAGRVSARLDPLNVLAAVPNELTLSVAALATLGWTMQMRSDRRVAALGWGGSGLDRRLQPPGGRRLPRLGAVRGAALRPVVRAGQRRRPIDAAFEPGSQAPASDRGHGAHRHRPLPSGPPKHARSASSSR